MRVNRGIISIAVLAMSASPVLAGCELQGQAADIAKACAADTAPKITFGDTPVASRVLFRRINPRLPSARSIPLFYADPRPTELPPSLLESPLRSR